MKRTVRSMKFKSFDAFASEYPALGSLLCSDDHEFLDAMRRRVVDGLHLSQTQIDAMRKFLPPGQGGAPPPVGQLVSVRATLTGTRKVDRGHAYYHWEARSRRWAGLLDIVSASLSSTLEGILAAVPNWGGAVIVRGRVVRRRRSDSGWHLVIRGEWLAANAKRAPARQPAGRQAVAEPVTAELAKCDGDDDWLASLKS